MPLEAEASFREVAFGKGVQTIQATYKNVSGDSLLITSPLQCPLVVMLKLEIRVSGLSKHQSISFEKTNQDQIPLSATGQALLIEDLNGNRFETGIKFPSVCSDNLKAPMSLINSSDQALQS
jgi:hypothetical protein